MKIASLHHITQDLPNVSHAEQAALACAGGVKWVQLRTKNKSFDEWCAIAHETKEVCVKHGATFIINDSVEVAKEVEANGVHLGQSDGSPKLAREQLGAEAIIGGTASTLDQLVSMVENGVNYVGVGPFRFTNTKKNLSPVLGLEGYKQMLITLRERGIEIPLIAIGGIQTTDVIPLIEIGIHGIAISSSINLAPSPTDASRSFTEALIKHLA